MKQIIIKQIEINATKLEQKWIKNTIKFLGFYIKNSSF